MLWFWIILSAGLVVIGLIYVLQRFESESNARALEEIQQLKQEIEVLRHRIENLETIATEEKSSSSQISSGDLEHYSRTSAESEKKSNYKRGQRSSGR